MSSILGLDIGSSSVIAGILRGTKVLKESPRTFFKSQCAGQRVEVAPESLPDAVARAISSLGEEAKNADYLAMAVMCPAWVAMDRDGRALTPIITHQDRRSVEEAAGIEKRIGKSRHLKITGCRPFPGGISSTTWAWYLAHEPARLRKADLVGHLNTFLHRQLTGARVTDPSNASFTGLYETRKLRGWSHELCAGLGVSESLLPQVLEANKVAGSVLPGAASRFGLRAGMPVLTGIVDGSAGMLFAGAEHGKLFNVTGSTDVLALCTTKPAPQERLLTRALGIDGKFLAVSTLAAVASAIYWARDQFFSEWPIEQFRKEFHRLARLGQKASGGVVFDPCMAGERTSIVQRKGAFHGITLATTRTHLLSAILEGLILASAERLPLLAATGTPLLPDVAVSGGGDRLDKILRRDWQGQWRFHPTTDATMRGLGLLIPEKP
ncbi:MAG: FGGY family carbohydrate kinase [Verrucomicrobia bacterium]|nr:FGGY family carbohydrate kinase [Verrucomicrobiota bacterium]